jgi:hypothetical protein
MTNTEKLQDFKTVFEDFLNFREWHNDKVVFDEANQQWQIGTSIVSDDHKLNLYIEGEDSTGFLKIFIYYNIKCRESKVKEMHTIMNWINNHLSIGKFELVVDTVRWVLRYDTEEIVLNGYNVSRNLQYGWDATGMYGDVISAVALTKITAEEAIADFEESRE